MVWRYSSSATVAWSDAMGAILVCDRRAAAEPLHAPRRERHEGARGRREVRVTARDEGERVDDGGVEGGAVQAARERAAERHLARADGVAEAACGEVERRLDVLDLDLGLER